MPPTVTKTAGGNYDTPVGVGGTINNNTGQLITSSNTSPTIPTTYNQPNYPSSPDISTLSTDYTPLTATTQENQASALSTRLQALNDQLAGEPAAQTEANTNAGVDSINQAINDNNTAVKQLQNDSAAAKLNAENRLAPTFAISGEQGAIDRSTAVKALTLSSISDVLQNNLVAAQNKANAAVAAQYGPLEAELKAKTANLNLILNDPATTLADKNRAQQQSLQLQQQASDLADAKATTQNIQALAVTAAQQSKTFTPTSQYPTLSTALNAIATAKDVVTATTIAQQTGLAAPGKVSTSIQDIGGRTVQIVTDEQGNIVKQTDLGSSATYSELHPTNTPQDSLSSLSSLVSSNGNGQTLPGTNGTPILDKNGFITPEALKYFISQAPQEKLTTAQVITTLAPYISTENGTVASAYGLNAAMAKLLNAAP